MGHLYIEWTPIDYVGFLGYRHLYLVYRPTENAPFEQWEIIRGGPETSPIIFNDLEIFTGKLSEIDQNIGDHYDIEASTADHPSAADPSLTNAQYYAQTERGAHLIGEIDSAQWANMKLTAESIGGPDQYNYELHDELGPEVNLDPALNSNSLVASVLAHHGFTLDGNYPVPPGDKTPGDKHILGTSAADMLKLAPTGGPFTPGTIENGHKVVDGYNINLSGGQGNDSLIGNDAGSRMRT